jgi:hypothetical protein
METSVGSAQESTSFTFSRVAGDKYCVPWVTTGGAAKGTTAQLCKDLCAADESCVAVNWFPTYGVLCYLFDVCSSTAQSSAQGQVYMKEDDASDDNTVDDTDVDDSELDDIIEKAVQSGAPKAGVALPGWPDNSTTPPDWPHN